MRYYRRIMIQTLPRSPTLLRRLRDRLYTADPRCHYCGRDCVAGPIKGEGRSRRPTVDHVEATSAGGSNLNDNLVLACHGCNTAKGGRSIHEARHSLKISALGWPKFSEDEIEWLRGRGFDLSEYDGFVLWFERADR